MYKIYKSGEEFLQDNGEALRLHPTETVFMESNARALTQCDDSNYAVKIWKENAFLLAIERRGVPLRIWGDAELVGETAEVLAANGLRFESVLGFPDFCNGFLSCYEKICGGSHSVKHSMDIMCCLRPKTCDVEGVRFATEEDAPTLAKYFVEFLREAVQEEQSYDDLLQKVRTELSDIVILEEQGKIVSIAKKSQDAQTFARLSYVYTLPEMRNRGYSKLVVTFLTQKIVESGSVAYLFVDKTNPISNHLYRAIGYEYAMPQFEITYHKD